MHRLPGHMFHRRVRRDEAQPGIDTTYLK
jgi:hypothetical protein